MYSLGKIPVPSSSHLPNDEVSNDAVQLIMVSVFNGLCRLIGALAENGLLSDDQVRTINDAMTSPLDDPDHRDDDFITFTRQTLEEALAKALLEIRNGD